MTDRAMPVAGAPLRAWNRHLGSLRKLSRITQYHKEGRALRTETTINNAHDCKIGKRPVNLPKLRQIGFAANRRLLGLERLSHDGVLAETTFRAIDRPISRGGQRASGLRFADTKGHNFWQRALLLPPARRRLPQRRRATTSG